ncbi:hypothetical protein [Methylosinus sp. Sm6]|uniref:hypothetical protein n=1 Tax=Methylosinus sp. Sm6 TaxID=2866948 RepID=UPI001C995662|nr:hypothetical protein [Methylosinus sp. Sm6]MBY6240231.1 hypothetical protein [Methylosinus sp. Sm6]
MRRPIRPFVKEYKSRSAKPVSRAGADDAASEPTPRFLEPPPRFLEPPPASPRVRDADDSYEAAMRAADLVFGKKAPPAPPQAEVAFSPQQPQPALAQGDVLLVAEAAPAEAPALRPTGRILPSLIEADVLPPREPEPPARKRGRPRKVAPPPPASDEAERPVVAAPAPRKPRRPAPLVAPLPIFAESDDEAELDEEIFDEEFEEERTPAGPRRLSRIQARWVRRTELMAGEKWKRRLPHSSRPR